MTPDSELLRQFAETHSEDAFAELVKRHVNLVYSAALRQVNGDSHLAQDVSQTVFADLARKAAALSRRATLTGWLYTSAHFAAAKIIRTERRRQAREQEAVTMTGLLNDSAPEQDWNKLRPVLDQFMHELKESDREAILLRYFENRPFAEVGAKLGLNENTARMRVERALEKLRALLAHRGITTTVALSTVISASAVQAAPASLVAAITNASLAAVASTTTLTLLKIMIVTHLKTVLAVVAIAGTVTTVLIQHQAQTALRGENRSLRQQMQQVQDTNEQLSNSLLQADQLSDARLNESQNLQAQLQALQQQTNLLARSLLDERTQLQNTARNRASAEPFSGIIDMGHADIFSVAAIYSTLIQRPVAVNCDPSMPTFTYRSQGSMSREQVIADMTSALLQQGIFLMEINQQALKMVNARQTNDPTEIRWIQIEVQTNSILIDGQPVAFENLIKAIKALMTPATEIWIHDSNPKPMVRTQGNTYTPSIHPPNEIYNLLLSNRIGLARIFYVYLPRK